jgi:hypothetical protein
MKTSEEIEKFLSKFTKEYIHLFNMLERNISYSLRYMSEIKSSPKSIEEIQAMSFCKKIKNIKEIIAEKQLNSTFNGWLETLESCRFFRNNLVHGNWEVVWFLEKPIRFDAFEIAGKISKPIRGDFTTKDLSNELEKLEQIGDEFSKLRKEYEKLKFTQTSGADGV